MCSCDRFLKVGEVWIYPFPHGVINIGSRQALLGPHFFSGDIV